MGKGIPDDDDCAECGAAAELQMCCACGVTAMITNCGHQFQPRPLAAGRIDGSDGSSTYCTKCAESFATAYFPILKSRSGHGYEALGRSFKSLDSAGVEVLHDWMSHSIPDGQYTPVDAAADIREIIATGLWFATEEEALFFAHDNDLGRQYDAFRIDSQMMSDMINEHIASTRGGADED